MLEELEIVKEEQRDEDEKEERKKNHHQEEERKVEVQRWKGDGGEVRMKMDG